MRDPLKNFVERNRIDFDDLEAPKADWSRIRKTAPTNAQNSSNYKWLWMAASMLVVCGLGFTLFVVKQEDALFVEPTLVATPNKKTLNVQPIDVVKPAKGAVQVSMPKEFKVITKVPVKTERVNLEGLSDLSSASNRLLTILNIEKSGQMDAYTARKIAETLTYDDNTNVRLAALNLLNQFRQKKYVSDLLIESFDVQTDPMVQLGMISSIGKSNDPKVNQRLLQMVETPTTLSVVRDEAYMLLMTQNIL